MKHFEKSSAAGAKRVTIAGMLLALGILLPYVTSHMFGIQGTVLLPMHLPVFLMGLLCGPLFGAVGGALIPALSSVLTGMPATYPMLPIMACELTAYGLVSGLLYTKTGLNRKKWGVYPALLGAMICGKLVYAGVFQLLLILNPGLKALSVTAALVTGLPGIVIQLLLVPAVVTAVNNSMGWRKKDATASAVNLIREGTASCVVLKSGRIMHTAKGSGVRPLLELLDVGCLRDAFVVDKIVGKAAAMILVLGGATEVYGETMSVAARDYLNARNIEARCGRLIDMIENRQKNGICPMERAVMDIKDPADGVKALRETLAALAQKQA